MQPLNKLISKPTVSRSLLFPLQTRSFSTGPNYVQITRDYLDRFNNFNDLTKEELASYYSSATKQGGLKISLLAAHSRYS